MVPRQKCKDDEPEGIVLYTDNINQRRRLNRQIGNCFDVIKSNQYDVKMFLYTRT